MNAGLADAWRAARPPVAGLHLDSAACSRQSFGVLDFFKASQIFEAAAPAKAKLKEELAAKLAWA